MKKAGYHDLYNVTKIIRVLEKGFKSLTISPQIALTMCIAGNDFLSKYYKIPHFTFMKLFCQHKYFVENLYNLETAKIEDAVFLEFLKYVYSPNSLNPQRLSYEEVRQRSIKPPQQYKGKQNVVTRKEDMITFRFSDGQVDLKDPCTWLLPASCALKIVTLYDAMFQYLLGLQQA